MATPGPSRSELHVPDDVLDDLRDAARAHALARRGRRLRLARTAANLGYMRELVEHWRDGFDWRAQEARLNAFAAVPRRRSTASTSTSSTSPASGRIRCRSCSSHGWPGSVWEFDELIPRLTDPARFGGDPADAFTVVAPSLPGYTFSFRPDQPRFDVARWPTRSPR